MLCIVRQGRSNVSCSFSKMFWRVNFHFKAMSINIKFSNSRSQCLIFHLVQKIISSTNSTLIEFRDPYYFQLSLFQLKIISRLNLCFTIHVLFGKVPI